MIGFLARRFIQDYQNTADAAVRRAYGMLCGAVGIAINLLLFAVFASFMSFSDGSLWGVCAMHGAWNWAQGNLFVHVREFGGQHQHGGTL